MNKSNNILLNRLRLQNRIGQQPQQPQQPIVIQGSDAANNQAAIIQAILGNIQVSVGSEAYFAEYQSKIIRPAQNVLLDSNTVMQESYQILAGIPDVMSDIESFSENQEGFLGSILTLEQRNADLNESFGISTLDAQIFADSLIKLGDSINVNQDSLKQYAKDLANFTNGFIISTNSVHKATTAQKNYTDSLLAGQRYLQQNLNLSSEIATKFEEYAVSMKTTAYDLAKNMQEKDGFISMLAEETGLSELQLTRDIIQDIANLSADVRFEFGKSSSHLETAVLKARMLGTTMSSLSKIGTTLLNVEESVSNEVNYQLLTGKRLLVDGDKSFTQEFRLAKLRKDGPRQAELLNQVLIDQKETLRNVPGAMEQFAATTSLTTEEIATSLNKIDLAEQLGIQDFLKSDPKKFNEKLEELKTQAQKDLKEGGAGANQAQQRLNDINKFLSEGPTTETTHEKLVQDNLLDITRYLKQFVTEYNRNNKGRVSTVNQGKVGDLTTLGKNLRGYLREESGGTGPKKLQDFKKDLQTQTQKLGQTYLYKNITGFETGVLKQANLRLSQVTDDETRIGGTGPSVNERNKDAAKAVRGVTPVPGKSIATSRTAKSKQPTKNTTTTTSPNNNQHQARGGILQGPSHAKGGIITPFGELEGGEAIINKESTAKYAPLLSSINQAEGGAKISPTFRKGGVANKLVGGTSNIIYNNYYDSDNSETVSSIKKIVDIFSSKTIKTVETIFKERESQIVKNEKTETIVNDKPFIEPTNISNNTNNNMLSSNNKIVKTEDKNLIKSSTSNILNSFYNDKQVLTNINNDKNSDKLVTNTTLNTDNTNKNLNKTLETANNTTTSKFDEILNQIFTADTKFNSIVNSIFKFKPETINETKNQNTQTANIINDKNIVKSSVGSILNSFYNDKQLLTSINTNENLNKTVTDNILSSINNDKQTLTTVNTVNPNMDAIETEQKQLELSQDAISYSPEMIYGKLNTDKFSAIIESLNKINSPTSSPNLDTKTLARDFAEAMKNVNIQTTAVVKTDNSFKESYMNNANKFSY